MDFFAAATPCNPLGRFVLTHSAQNDKNKPKARFACHTEALAKVSKNPLYCHTELSQESEVSTNLKCDFSALRCVSNFYGFFATLKMTMPCCFCKWIFRFLMKAQNDKFPPNSKKFLHKNQIPPKIQSKTKIPLTKKTIPYYIYTNFSHQTTTAQKNSPPL